LGDGRKRGKEEKGREKRERDGIGITHRSFQIRQVCRPTQGNTG